MAYRKVRDFLYVMKEKNVVREGLEMAFLTLKVFCGLHVANKYLFTIVLPYGPSMLPTLSLNGNLILAERISTRFGLVGPGDIVLVRSPLHPTLVVTKRLIGLEGDSVSYVVEPGKSDRTDTIVVPKGHVWVEGDNIYASRDSRNFGPVPYGLLEGKFIWRIWPPKDFGSLRPNKTEPILDKDLSSTEAI
ncbi:mitochondrial ATP-independent inner membrane protease subunit 1a-like isoform X1 [Humulus lupulus]|uniref:mitochondrial ATP-independent inner membrane protease subunit 1a-like isoform X1 n=1 Tax=Humulus lupulus TaxID=3486 RepID=UPI002B40C7F3|nr:mitochondrial ATP-independent inner membrane protease subunit 1a-like isoform X1 [Humulus lupulus]